MSRKIISVFLVLVLSLSLVLSVSAEPKAIDYVVDEFGNLADSELTELNEYAASLYDTCGVGIFYVYTYADPLDTYDIDSLTGGMEDYFIMMENESSWAAFKGGLGQTIDVAAEDELRAVYDAADTYIGGVEDFLYEAALYFPVIADTSKENTVEAEAYFVFDEAELLNDGKHHSKQHCSILLQYTWGKSL